MATTLSAVGGARDDAGWMTYVEAMPLLECSGGAVTGLVKAGRIRSRAQVGRRLPSLCRKDVERVAVERAEERRQAEERRAARAAPPIWSPPDDGEVWLSATEAGLVLGLTPTGMRYRADHDLIPHVRRGRRVWFRRDHVEQAAAARAFQAVQSAAGGHAGVDDEASADGGAEVGDEEQRVHG